ncbi:MAG: hypothetical protein ACT4P0_05040 [Panacagrimonas sp.]
MAKGEKPICGVVMPISEIDGCSSAHWSRVRIELERIIKVAGFKANLVSTSEDANIIHKNIFKNIATNPILVCDISGRNANVFFELGFRLAFEMPTIIVKDDRTPFSFDTSPIEHLPYPRDLNIAEMRTFEDQLVKKLKASHEAFLNDPTYSPLLSSFGNFVPARLRERNTSNKAKTFSFDEVRQYISKINRRMEREFAPDAIVTMSGPGSIAACCLSSENTRDIPLFVAVTFPLSSKSDHRKSLEDFRSVANSQSWRNIKTEKWDIFIPETVFNLGKDKRVVIFDDKVLSGTSQIKLQSELEKCGYQVKRAAVFSSTHQVQYLAWHGEALDEMFYMPWGPKDGRH